MAKSHEPVDAGIDREVIRDGCQPVCRTSAALVTSSRVSSGASAGHRRPWGSKSEDWDAMKDQPWAAAGRFGRVPALASTKNTVTMPVRAMLRAAAGLDRAPGKRAPRPCRHGSRDARGYSPQYPAEPAQRHRYPSGQPRLFASELCQSTLTRSPSSGTTAHQPVSARRLPLRARGRSGQTP
jgi:hypothetical protein